MRTRSERRPDPPTWASVLPVLDAVARDARIEDADGASVQDQVVEMAIGLARSQVRYAAQGRSLDDSAFGFLSDIYCMAATCAPCCEDEDIRHWLNRIDELCAEAFEALTTLPPEAEEAEEVEHERL